MSGGHFDYEDYRITDIADKIERIIANNDIESEFGWAPHYSPETLKQFTQCVELLQSAAVMVHRIDWLVSGDDGEETFHKRLQEDMEKLK